MNRTFYTVKEVIKNKIRKTKLTYNEENYFFKSQSLKPLSYSLVKIYNLHRFNFKDKLYFLIVYMKNEFFLFFSFFDFLSPYSRYSVCSLSSDFSSDMNNILADCNEQESSFHSCSTSSRFIINLCEQHCEDEQMYKGSL